MFHNLVTYWDYISLGNPLALIDITWISPTHVRTLREIR